MPNLVTKGICTFCRRKQSLNLINGKLDNGMLFEAKICVDCLGILSSNSNVKEALEKVKQFLDDEGYI